MPSSEQKIFVSYSWKDRRFVDRLQLALATAGVHLWIDRFEMRAGDSLHGRVEAAIENASFVFVVLSPDSVSSPWVTDELRIAMTKQKELSSRFVVPILHKTCQVPLFLRDRLQVDFRNKRHFSACIQQILAAVDEQARTAKSVSDSQEGDNILKSMLQIKGIKGSAWAKSFRSMPITDVFSQIINIGSFSGQIVEDTMVMLTMLSHAQDGRSSNGLLALLGFLASVESQNIQSRDFLVFHKSAAELTSLETTYRWFCLSFLIKRLAKIENRRTRLDLLPSIFPELGRDQLADRIWSDFDKEPRSSNLLSDLWRASPVYYREQVLLYVCRVCKKESIIEIERLCEMPLLESAIAGLKAARVHAAVKDLQDDLLVDFFKFEDLSRNKDNDAVELTDLSISFLHVKNFKRYKKKYGSKRAYQLLSLVISSPYIDVGTSCLAVFAVIQEFGLGSLQYNRCFPANLITPKKAGVFSRSLPGVTRISVLIALIHASITDKISFITVVRILGLYRNPAMYSLAHVCLRELKSDASHMKNFNSFLLGEITASKVLDDENVVNWVNDVEENSF